MTLNGDSLLVVSLRTGIAFTVDSQNDFSISTKQKKKPFQNDFKRAHHHDNKIAYQRADPSLYGVEQLHMIVIIDEKAATEMKTHSVSLE